MVSWMAKKQTIISCSSAEAIGLWPLLHVSWFGCLIFYWSCRSFFVADLILLYNQADIHIASNPNFHERTKHVELDCHFIKDKVFNGFIRLRSIGIDSQLSDAFTKPPPAAILKSFMSKMGHLWHLSSILKGSIKLYDFTNLLSITYLVSYFPVSLTAGI